ncbi:Uncharacterized protein SCF082_LOCUS2445 [Durusdinium trenchii]|uniref:Uncharacterized protein n=1 Tax=Durusdinium trenchii TaxID=1381693 RepID=A0ABP0HL52_9DINO
MSLLTPRLDWIWGCCTAGCEAYQPNEYQVQLTSEPPMSNAKHVLTSGDSFDITFAPRLSGLGFLPSGPMTPRQLDLRSSLELPDLQAYPVPPHISADEVEEVYRIVKNDDKWYAAGTPLPNASPHAEHIVVVEFMRRKLAFVFKELQVSQRLVHEVNPPGPRSGDVKDHH